MDTTKILLKLMPSFLRKKIENKKELRKILDNINWLSFERIFKMLLGIFVTALVARYLGPEKFGLLNYAIAFVGLFAALYELGLDQIVVRNIVKKPKKEGDYLGTSFLLRFFGTILLVILSYIAITLVRPESPALHLFVIIVSVGFIFKIAETVDLWFQSQVLSKYRVYAHSIAFASSALLRILLILLSAPLIAFVIAVAIEQIIAAIGLFVFYYKKGRTALKKWKFKISTAKGLLRDSWPLILSGVAVAIYMKIDQVMIGKMISDNALGIYSSAVKLSETWYFIPTFVMMSVFPAIIYAKKKSKKLYLNRMQMLYDTFTWFTISVALIITFLSPFIIDLLYGAEYEGAATVLSIHIWAGVFVFLGVASSRYLVAENLTKISFYRTIAGAIANIGLNIFLIPIYGIVGAAMSTLLSYSVSAYFSNIFFIKSRKIFLMQTKSINIFRLLKIKDGKNKK